MKLKQIFCFNENDCYSYKNIPVKCLIKTYNMTRSKNEME